MDVKMSRIHENFGFLMDFNLVLFETLDVRSVETNIETRVLLDRLKRPRGFESEPRKTKTRRQKWKEVSTKSNWIVWIVRYWKCCGETVQLWNLERSSSCFVMLQRSEESRPNKTNCVFCITRNQVAS